MRPTPQLAATISARLAELRDEYEPMSQQDLAADIGIPTMVLNRTIRGTSTPNAQAIVRIAEYYGVSTDWLLGISNVRTSKRHRLRVTS